MFKLIEYQKYTDVWMDFRICLFSKYILKEYSSYNENLTYYRQTDQIFLLDLKNIHQIGGKEEKKLTLIYLILQR